MKTDLNIDPNTDIEAILRRALPAHTTAISITEEATHARAAPPSLANLATGQLDTWPISLPVLTAAGIEMSRGTTAPHLIELAADSAFIWRSRSDDGVFQPANQPGILFADLQRCEDLLVLKDDRLLRIRAHRGRAWISSTRLAPTPPIEAPLERWLATANPWLTELVGSPDGHPWSVTVACGRFARYRSLPDTAEDRATALKRLLAGIPDPTGAEPVTWILGLSTSERDAVIVWAEAEARALLGALESGTVDATLLERRDDLAGVVPLLIEIEREAEVVAVLRKVDAVGRNRPPLIVRTARLRRAALLDHEAWWIRGVRH